jgi:hypothetical protein
VIATQDIRSLLGKQMIAVFSRSRAEPFEQIPDLFPIRPLTRLVAFAPITPTGLGGLIVAD